MDLSEGSARCGAPGRRGACPPQRRRRGGGTMSRRMVRWTVAGALALAGAGVLGGLGVDLPAAEAGGVPFRGSFVGGVPGTYYDWSISIKGSGSIIGTCHFDNVISTRGSLSGTVDRDGSMHFTG